MKFSVLCLLHFVLFIRINFSLGWTCPVSVYSMSIFKFKPQHELFKTQLQNTEHKHDQRCTVQSRKFEADIRRLSLKSLLSKTNASAASTSRAHLKTQLCLVSRFVAFAMLKVVKSIKLIVFQSCRFQRLNFPPILIMIHVV